MMKIPSMGSSKNLVPATLPLPRAIESILPALSPASTAVPVLDHQMESLHADIRAREVEGAWRELEEEGSWWDWVSWSSWKTWGLNRVLNAVLGEPQVIPYLRSYLPLPLQHLSTVIAQLSREILTEQRLFRMFMNYGEARDANQELWANVRADSRIATTVENSVLIILDNTLSHIKRRVWEDRDNEYMLDLASSVLSATDRHFDDYLEGLSVYPEAGGKRQDWFDLYGSRLHQGLSSSDEIAREYYASVGELLIQIGLPMEGRELVHVASFARAEAYMMVKGITPDLVKTIQKQALSEDAINHLVVKVIGLFNKDDPADWESSIPRTVQTYSGQGKLNRRLGRIARKTGESLYPRISQILFGALGLEGSMGSYLGKLLTRAMRSVRLDSLIEKGTNGALAVLCEGECLRDPDGHAYFQPEFLEREGGERVIRLASPTSPGGRQCLAARAEKDLAVFMRDILPKIAQHKWQRFWARIDSIWAGTPLLKSLVRPRQVLQAVLGALLGLLWRGVQLHRLVAWLGLCITQPIAQNLLRLLHHPAHENLYLHVQDVVLDHLLRED